jgi:hypothetical protein
VRDIPFVPGHPPVLSRRSINVSADWHNLGFEPVEGKQPFHHRSIYPILQAERKGKKKSEKDLS